MNEPLVVRGFCYGIEDTGFWLYDKPRRLPCGPFSVLMSPAIVIRKRNYREIAAAREDDVQNQEIEVEHENILEKTEKSPTRLRISSKKGGNDAQMRTGGQEKREVERAYVNVLKNNGKSTP
jgi:hypothetical protein